MAGAAASSDPSWIDRSRTTVRSGDASSPTGGRSRPRAIRHVAHADPSDNARRGSSARKRASAAPGRPALHPARGAIRGKRGRSPSVIAILSGPAARSAPMYVPFPDRLAGAVGVSDMRVAYRHLGDARPVRSRRPGVLESTRPGCEGCRAAVSALRRRSTRRRPRIRAQGQVPIGRQRCPSPSTRCRTTI